MIFFWQRSKYMCVVLFNFAISNEFDLLRYPSYKYHLHSSACIHWNKCRVRLLDFIFKWMCNVSSFNCTNQFIFTTECLSNLLLISS
jgi:hypothetical protein